MHRFITSLFEFELNVKAALQFDFIRMIWTIFVIKPVVTRDADPHIFFGPGSGSTQIRYATLVGTSLTS